MLPKCPQILLSYDTKVIANPIIESIYFCYILLLIKKTTPKFNGQYNDTKLKLDTVLIHKLASNNSINVFLNQLFEYWHQFWHEQYPTAQNIHSCIYNCF